MRPALVPLDHVDSLASPLGVVSFGAAAPTLHANRLSLPLPYLGPRLAEVWTVDDAVEQVSDDGLTFATSQDVMFGAIVADDADVERAALRVYDRIVTAARAHGFPNLLRIWNHVRGINGTEGELERYRSFCRGRHDAFAALGYGLRADLPAASGVGMSGGSLATYFLASRNPARQVENPRQVSAYDYPPEYGPRSPSFSRATVANGLVFISGTASIAGHKSMHVGDVDAQLDETLLNLDRVATASGAKGLSDVVYLKVYVRNPGDYERIAARLANAVAAPALFLESEICRAELLLEIEAVVRA